MTFKFKLVFLFVTVQMSCAIDPGTHKVSSQTHEFFTAASDMEILRKVEKKLATKFLLYFNQEQERLDALEKEIRHIEQSLPSKTLDDGQDERWVSTTTNAYKIVKRFVNFWPNITNYSKKKIHGENVTKLQAKMVRLQKAFPSDEDLRGSLAAIVRLQDTYDIPSEDFIDGLGPLSHKLNLEEIFEFGFLCTSIGDYKHAQKWFKEALYRFPPGISQIGFLDKISLIEYLAWSEYQLGNYEKAIKHTENILKIQPTHNAANVNVKLFKEEQINSNGSKPIKQTKKSPSWEKKYAKLCQGREKMEQKHINRLFCKISSPRPRFIYKPLKIEQAYDDPEVFIYHDFLRDHEMGHIKKKGFPLLRRATVHHPVTNELMYADYRVSKSAWIAPEMDEVVAGIIEKTGDAVNLNMRYSEEMQIANYGLAGQYEPHFDHSTKENPKAFEKYGGNRIATMLLYLSEVYRGGSTVFTNTGPGVTVNAEKGAGVFWFNLLRNGKSNPKTQHAGCPVVTGVKWVSNLWIHEHGQEFKRPCAWNKNK